jgi:hypothetical protein
VDATAAETFERDGFLTFDPQVPEKTIDRAVADVEHGPQRKWLPFLRAPSKK